MPDEQFNMPRNLNNMFPRLTKSEMEDIARVSKEEDDVSLRLCNKEEYNAYPEGMLELKVKNIQTKDHITITYDPKTGIIYSVSQILHLPNVANQEEDSSWLEFMYYGEPDPFLEFTINSGAIFGNERFEDLENMYFGEYDLGDKEDVNLSLYFKGRSNVDITNNRFSSNRVILDDGSIVTLNQPAIVFDGNKKFPYPISLFARKDDAWEGQVRKTPTGAVFTVKIPDFKVINGSYTLVSIPNFLQMVLNKDFRPVIPVNFGIDSIK